MLLRFDIENFRSINKKVSLSFEATSSKELQDNYFTSGDKCNILKSSVVYGANASGKSNVLKAFQSLGFLIKHSFEFMPGKAIDTYDPFKLDVNTQHKAVFFEIEFIAKNNIQYVFSLSFTQHQIEKEELCFFPKGQRSTIYKRSQSLFKFGDYYKGERKSIQKQLLPNQLFLSKAVMNNVELLLPVYEFFDKKLKTFVHLSKNNGSKDINLYAKRLADLSDKNFSKKFNALICSLDIGISNVEARKTDWSTHAFPDSLPSDIQNQIKSDYEFKVRTLHSVFNHGKSGKGIYFEKEDESQGTQSLFILAGIIIDALEKGQVLIIDEFEKNLHPHITKQLVKLFHKPFINTKNAQLLFATHDISQLDNDVLRRDQIWFTEKDEFASTSLFSLAEIKGVRNTIPYDKWYDSGKFGATPLISEPDIFYEKE
jgi:uncharacterized protein